MGSGGGGGYSLHGVIVSQRKSALVRAGRQPSVVCSKLNATYWQTTPYFLCTKEKAFYDKTLPPPSDVIFTRLWSYPKHPLRKMLPV